MNLGSRLSASPANLIIIIIIICCGPRLYLPAFHCVQGRAEKLGRCRKGRKREGKSRFQAVFVECDTGGGPSGILDESHKNASLEACQKTFSDIINTSAWSDSCRQPQISLPGFVLLFPESTCTATEEVIYWLRHISQINPLLIQIAFKSVAFYYGKSEKVRRELQIAQCVCACACA